MTTDDDHTKHDHDEGEHDEGEHDGQRPLPILGAVVTAIVPPTMARKSAQVFGLFRLAFGNSSLILSFSMRERAPREAVR